MNMRFSVLGPLGQHVGEAKPIAARVPDLKGKTVCEVWNGFFWGDAMFPTIRELLEKRYPGINVIPYTKVPIFSPTENTDELCKSLKETISQRGCDAVIAGVGG